MTVRELRESLVNLRARIAGGEIVGMTLDEFDAIPICVRIIENEEAEVHVCNLTSIEMNDHGDEWALVLDGEIE